MALFFWKFSQEYRHMVFVGVPGYYYVTSTLTTCEAELVIDEVTSSEPASPEES